MGERMTSDDRLPAGDVAVLVDAGPRIETGRNAILEALRPTTVWTRTGMRRVKFGADFRTVPRERMTDEELRQRHAKRQVGYRKRKRDKINAKQREQYARDPSKARANNAAWFKRNRARRSAYLKAWRLKNLDRLKAYLAAYRAAAKARNA